MYYFFIWVYTGYVRGMYGVCTGEVWIGKPPNPQGGIDKIVEVVWVGSLQDDKIRESPLTPKGGIDKIVAVVWVRSLQDDKIRESPLVPKGELTRLGK